MLTMNYRAVFDFFKLIATFFGVSFPLFAQYSLNFSPNSTFITEPPLPFEISFHPSYTNLIFKNELQNFSFSYFGLKINLSSFNSSPLHISTKQELTFLKPVSPFVLRASNFTIEYSQQNFVYFGSIITQFTLNEGNSVFLDLYSFQMGVQYKFLNLKWLGSISAGLKLGVQQVYDFTLSDRNKRFDFKQKTNFFTQGLFLNGKGFMIEGLVRLPMREVYEHEVLMRPEYFGRLGLYWNLPDKIKP